MVYDGMVMFEEMFIFRQRATVHDLFVLKYLIENDLIEDAYRLIHEVLNRDPPSTADIIEESSEHS